VLKLFCRTARVLAGSVGFCLKLAREDARGPAEEVVSCRRGLQITVARLRIENLRRKDFYGQFMNRTLMEEAYMHWSSGNSIEAGRLIYDQIPNDERPSWAAEILDLCRGLIPRVPEIDAIYEIASDRSRWPEAYESFRSVRQLTLDAERSSSTDSVYAGILFVTENVAKVAYNASRGPAPFDHDAGWWLVSNLHHIADLVGTPEFESKAWTIVSART